jgi:FixJ family two-component response regulator
MTDLGLPSARALAVADAYDRLNLAQRGRAWTTEELTLGRPGLLAGLSNRQIGARLHLSHGTVSSHLHRMFPKLGISSRAALRDALSRQNAY